MIKRTLLLFSCLVLLSGFSGNALAQSADEESPYSFGGDAALVSKYIWRGQRLTDDWSLQPGATVGIGPVSFNVWGTMDLTAINPGDSLFIDEDPAAPPGDNNGLQGKFSEVDYTFSVGHSFENITIDAGTIFYTFPERSASLASTTEIYGGVTFDSVPLAPSATIYVDVDESSSDGGDTGVYFLLGAGGSIPFDNPNFTGLDISGSLAFVNGGFGSFYYGDSQAGLHDASITFSLPIELGSGWSASGFVTVSALTGDFRDFQFQDPRAVFRGTAGDPADDATTVWGGFTISLGF